MEPNTTVVIRKGLRCRIITKPLNIENSGSDFMAIGVLFVVAEKVVHITVRYRLNAV